MFDMQPRLRGALVDLRPTVAADWSGLFALGSDREVWAQHPESDRGSHAKFQTYFDEGLAAGALTARSVETDEIIGWSRYSHRFAGPGEVEIGWTFLGTRYWGRGYNSEMKRLMLAHAFTAHEAVIFRIGAQNHRSRRAVEKLGATLTAPRTPAASEEAAHVVYRLEKTRVVPAA